MQMLESGDCKGMLGYLNLQITQVSPCPIRWQQKRSNSCYRPEATLEDEEPAEIFFLYSQEGKGK